MAYKSKDKLNLNQRIYKKKRREKENKIKGWTSTIFDNINASAHLRKTRGINDINIWEETLRSFYTSLYTQGIKTKTNKRRVDRRGYDLEKFKDYLSRRNLSRSGKNYANDKINLIGEMYYSNIFTKLAQKNYAKSPWDKKIQRMMTSIIERSDRHR